jgi:hypothetical protein
MNWGKHFPISQLVTKNKTEIKIINDDTAQINIFIRYCQFSKNQDIGKSLESSNKIILWLLLEGKY